MNIQQRERPAKGDDDGEELELFEPESESEPGTSEPGASSQDEDSVGKTDEVNGEQLKIGTLFKRAQLIFMTV